MQEAWITPVEKIEALLRWEEILVLPNRDGSDLKRALLKDEVERGHEREDVIIPVTSFQVTAK